MNIKSILLTISIMLLMSACRANDIQDGSVSVVRLRVETNIEPMALDVRKPRLSWEIQSEKRAVHQTHYRILVASSKEKLDLNEGDLWDSGKIRSDKSIQIPYEGMTLTSRMNCFWKVKVWCGKSGSSWSEHGFWQVGLLDELDWNAGWIGLDRAFEWDVVDQFSRLSARYFRKEFDIDGQFTQARLYLIGLGLYELYVNGLKVGYQVLAPTPTDYTQEVKYTAFELAAFLKQGRNAIGVVLGNGRFFNMRQNFKPWKINTFGFPKLLFQLELTKADGSTLYILSDSTWRVTSDGPIRSNNEFDGEEYDATKELTGWNKPGYDASDWLSVDLTTDPGENRQYFADSLPQGNEPKTPHGDLTLKRARRRAQINEDMNVLMTVKPISIKRLNATTHILDMGQNMAGWLRIQVQGKRGHQVSLRFAESLQPDGNLYVENLRDAKVTDVYTLKGGGLETWSPSFVYHGFRYVEVTNWPGEPALTCFEGQVVSDAMNATGTLTSSDTTLNSLFKNAWWGVLGNYKGMPVDCPQRNERQPWLGDRSTGCWGESYLFDNQRLYAKWLDDIQQAMSQEGQISDVSPNYYNYYTDNVTWPATYHLVAYMLYRQYGDVYSIQKHYPSMKKWMQYMENRYMKDGIMTRDKYGDWCMPPESPELIHSRDSNRITDGALIATAYYCRLLQIMQEFAELLDKPADKKAFANLESAMADAFRRRFYHPDKHYYGNNTVTSNMLPLTFGLVPEEEVKAVFDHICRVIEVDNNGHIATGVIGTSWLMRTLCTYGRSDLAYRIATNRTYPSWGYMIENGATTIWELWNGNTANPKMNSQNHVMLLGDLLIWYYENLAGIKSAPDAPGFKRIIMNPDFPEGLSFVRASYRSMHGLIVSDWSKDDKVLVWEIMIPANTEAEIHFPAPKNQVFEGASPASKADGVKFLRMEKDRSVFKVGSGTYRFRFSI